MTTQEQTVSNSTGTSPFSEQYPYAVLFADVEDQQAQINDLRTEISDIKKRYVPLSDATQISRVAVGYTQGQSQPLQVIRHPQSFIEITDFDFSAFLRDASTAPSSQTATPAPDVKVVGAVSTVPLHSLLKFTGALMGATAVASIAFWITGRPPILNPFISLMTLVASPFAYLMGVAAKRR